MKNTPVIKSMDYLHEDGNTQQCLLIELDADAAPRQLIVPRVLVVEIIDAEGLEVSAQADSGLAVFNWRGVDVPLVPTSVLDPANSGQDKAGDVSNTTDKIVIFHGLANPQKLAFYALRTSRNPRLVNVSDRDISQSSSKKLQETELMSVIVNDETAIIPKVDYLEQYIHELHSKNQRQGDRQ